MGTFQASLKHRNPKKKIIHEARMKPPILIQHQPTGVVYLFFQKSFPVSSKNFTTSVSNPYIFPLQKNHGSSSNHPNEFNSSKLQYRGSNVGALSMQFSMIPISIVDRALRPFDTTMSMRTSIHEETSVV